MKTLGQVLVLMVAVLLCSMGCTNIGSNELAFKYSVSEEKPITKENNPLLSYGLEPCCGRNTFIFRVTSNAQQHTFKQEVAAGNPFDESIRFDSGEGVSMYLEPTLKGHVADVWEFFTHYGKDQYAYPHGISMDPRIFKALRDARARMAVHLGEIIKKRSLVDIRRDLVGVQSALLDDAREYSAGFGFSLDGLLLGKFEIVAKDAGPEIKKAMEMLGQANAELQEATKGVESTKGQKNLDIAVAERESNETRAAADRRAAEIISAGTATATELKKVASQIGPQKAAEMLIVQELAGLMRDGLVTKAILTEDSFMGRGFYK